MNEYGFGKWYYRIKIKSKRARRDWFRKPKRICWNYNYSNPNWRLTSRADRHRENHCSPSRLRCDSSYRWDKDYFVWHWDSVDPDPRLAESPRQRPASNRLRWVGDHGDPAGGSGAKPIPDPWSDHLGCSSDGVAADGAAAAGDRFPRAPRAVSPSWSLACFARGVCKNSNWAWQKMRWSPTTPMCVHLVFGNPASLAFPFLFIYYLHNQFRARCVR